MTLMWNALESDYKSIIPAPSTMRYRHTAGPVSNTEAFRTSTLINNTEFYHRLLKCKIQKLNKHPDRTFQYATRQSRGFLLLTFQTAEPTHTHIHTQTHKLCGKSLSAASGRVFLLVPIQALHKQHNHMGLATQQATELLTGDHLEKPP